MDLNDVVDAWKKATPNDIHPLRNVDELAYWESGVAQAKQAAKYIPAGGTVVDFGCGDGRLAIPLAQAGFDVTGIDASPTMIANLTARARDARVKLHAAISNGTDLDSILDEQVDVIVCRAVLIHHSHADGNILVHALAKHIKPGGYFIADWPTGKHYLRQNWIDVTVWTPEARLKVATSAGLDPTYGEQNEPPSVWRKKGGE